MIVIVKNGEIVSPIDSMMKTNHYKIFVLADQKGKKSLSQGRKFAVQSNSLKVKGQGRYDKSPDQKLPQLQGKDPSIHRHSRIPESVKVLDMERNLIKLHKKGM